MRREPTKTFIQILLHIKGRVRVNFSRSSALPRGPGEMGEIIGPELTGCRQTDGRWEAEFRSVK